MKAEQRNVPSYFGVSLNDNMKKTHTGASTNYAPQKSIYFSNLIEYSKKGQPRRLMVSHQLANKGKTAS